MRNVYDRIFELEAELAKKIDKDAVPIISALIEERITARRKEEEEEE